MYNKPNRQMFRLADDLVQHEQLTSLAAQVRRLVGEALDDEVSERLLQLEERAERLEATVQALLGKAPARRPAAEPPVEATAETPAEPAPEEPPAAEEVPKKIRSPYRRTKG